jgi:tRNA-2-methylthio-N6-dimethylallyladenosine synthase
LKVKNKRKKEGKNTVIAVAGCVAQAEGAEIKARAPYVDIVVGPQSYQRLPQLVENAELGSKAGLDLDFSTVNKFDFLNEEVEAREQKNDFIEKSTAFLTVQEGCDKFCTFCVVPYTRGPEYSRSVSEIYREALKLVSEGVKELNLLGQNVNAFHGKGENGEIITLGKLVDHLAKIKGLERIRYTTSHPRDVDEDLINSHKYNEKLMPFVHLPVQSGSDRILAEMNRKHTSDDYRRVIDRFLAARSDIEFSSDFIVGYPNESEKDFRDTMKLIEDIKFSLSYSFIYSPRPGTKAAILEDNITKEVKVARLQELQALLETQMHRFLANKVGKTMPVLVSRKGKYEGHYLGFTPYMQPVIIENGREYFNQIIDVTVETVRDRALTGRFENLRKAA